MYIRVALIESVTLLLCCKKHHVVFFGQVWSNTTQGYSSCPVYSYCTVSASLDICAVFQQFLMKNKFEN